MSRTIGGGSADRTYDTRPQPGYSDARSLSSLRGEATLESDDIYDVYSIGDGELRGEPTLFHPCVLMFLGSAVGQTVDRSRNLWFSTRTDVLGARYSCVPSLNLEILLNSEEFSNSVNLLAGLPINGCYDHSPPHAARHLR